ncbi:hypothetical protein MIZ03_2174 [Rhodoferax lithotrophicus]|uniref:Uncharacterized protein n=1 Tax=Rhodoferax lithotrophicus TaxID=2798804 RepID=A0ABN6D8X6_9BURK|nr:hypothetical protein MIZ03_2174 [Rhodoferax sp. MIZ03]
MFLKLSISLQCRLPLTRLDQELGTLADAAKGAADRADSAIDGAMAFIAASNKRIASIDDLIADD